ncbi:hypothetical protein JQC91_11370 [Jannaschia sp. Os4]|uniref:hypothetical protein n=1 Tax=Jannaschia sp. Os4 TaxID=2807617 RepID=UPI00193AD28B|nr:hypothetical protein [Jannaschia sp. Os4]MBM2576900.1 hypothetical protein [Jannaschia sp. Os4]
MTKTATTRATFLAALAALTVGALGVASYAKAQPAPSHATQAMMESYPQLF